MKKTKDHAWSCLGSIACLLFIFFTGCERTEYDLLDPSAAGKWTLYTTSSGMPGNSIRDVKQDSKNNIWIASYGAGAAYYSGGKWTPYTTTNSPILSNNTTCVAEMANGTILIGTDDGISIKSSAGQWSSYTDPSYTMNVLNIKVTTRGVVWVGTEGNGFYINEGTGYENIYSPVFPNVYSIEEDAGGNIYLGTDNGLLKWTGTNWIQISTANGLPSNLVTALYTDSKKRLWIGTYGGTTVCFMDATGKLTQVNLMGGQTGSLIEDIYEDRFGHIWFATNYGGVICYDWNVPVSYKKSTGFYEDQTTSVISDKTGNVWIGLSTKGLAKYSLPLN